VFYRQLLDRLHALPGIQSAAGIISVPLAATGSMSMVSVEGQPPPLPGQVRLVDFRTISPGYFRTMSIPILAGRDFAWTDTNTTERAVVVSQTAARTFWPNGDAIGKRVTPGTPNSTTPWLSVVGIVADVRQVDLVRTPRPAMYVPATQDQGPTPALRDFVVRTSGDPAALAPSIRSAVWGIDSTLPVARVQTMEQAKATVTATQQFNLLLVSLFAGLALLLATSGLYGVTAYSVSQRTRELGIRVALGARGGTLLQLVLAQGARLTIIGLAVGTAAALALTRVMEALLFGIGARDPITFAGVGLLLLAVSLVASLVPAYRATRVDPVVALRT
jgi:predicted permease